LEGLQTLPIQAESLNREDASWVQNFMNIYIC